MAADAAEALIVGAGALWLIVIIHFLAELGK